jgi:CheY-like chemotaxis protein
MQRYLGIGPIIVVDDDPDDHEFMKDFCHRAGVSDRLRFFVNGFEALKYLKATTDKPFIILCDINMPVMNGLEFRKSINDDDYLRRKSIPFVFFSTAASPSQVREAYDLTVQGFFLKKPSISQTEESLKRILDYWRDCQHPNSVK